MGVGSTFTIAGDYGRLPTAKGDLSMPESFSTLRINPGRILDSFSTLSLIGATGDGGVSRVALGEAHLAARAWFRSEAESAGLDFHVDGAGNHSAILSSAGRVAPHSFGGAYRDRTLLLGSHLDSVPNGGRFDGALGVVAALEVLKTVKESGIRLKVNLEAIDFTDEEGTLVGLLGSSALAGRLHPEALKNPRGGRQNLLDGLARAGLSEERIFTAARPKESLAGYLELHIEQGKRLERMGVDIGIVSAIVGIRSYRLSFIGRADHAGSTLMTDRADASLGASAFTLAAREVVMRDFQNCVVNVGRMEFAPGAFNIVPARVDLSLEFRSPGINEFERLDAALMACAKEQAACFGLGLEFECFEKHAPNSMSEELQKAFADSCDDLRLTHTSLASGAIHDGQSFDGVCPIGMIFVPSVDGASHSPREFTKWGDCMNGANVLLQTVLRLAATG
jgi:beta-ureidopropionase / N-carbamoyl-L-amino-acid hydrolase